jgi:hypothetical protein
MLNDTEMKNISKPAMKYGDFIEDDDTYIGTNGTPLWGWICPSSTQDRFEKMCNGTYVDGPKSCRDPNKLKESCSGYRVCCTVHTWVGCMLAAKMLHAEDQWNWPAFFAYVDHWVATETGIAEVYGAIWISFMWRTYRNNLPGPVGVEPSPSVPLPEGEGGMEPTPYLCENPVGEKLMIDLGNKKVTGQAIIYNGQGNRVQQVACNQGQITINITDLAGGVYFLVPGQKGSILRFVVPQSTGKM